jgi:hypothetical protein
MPEQINNELAKLKDIAQDMALDKSLRTRAMEQIGRVGTRDGFLVLLDLAALENLPADERELALKQAQKTLKLNR